MRKLFRPVSLASIIFMPLFVTAQTSSMPTTPNQVGSNYKKASIADSVLVKKYAGLLKTEDWHVLTNIELYRNIEEWFQAPYAKGGCSKTGIDASCFVQQLYSNVYNIMVKMPSNEAPQKNEISLFKDKKEIKFGDLLFFKQSSTKSKKQQEINHVGFYLANGYFVQASNSGVNIANLQNGFVKNSFVTAGRLDAFAQKYGHSIIADKNAKDIANVSFNIDGTQRYQAENGSNNYAYNRGLELLRMKYANILNINKNEITVPEAFAFIDKYRTTNTAPACTNTTKDYCFVKKFYNEVFGFEIGNNQQTLLKSNAVAEFTKLNLSLSLGDLITINFKDKNTTKSIFGVYLYNDYFLHYFDNEVAISDINNPAFDENGIKYYRFKKETHKKMQKYIKVRRMNIKDEPLNVLKKEEVRTYINTTSTEKPNGINHLNNSSNTNTAVVQKQEKKRNKWNIFKRKTQQDDSNKNESTTSQPSSNTVNTKSSDKLDNTKPVETADASKPLDSKESTNKTATIKPADVPTTTAQAEAPVENKNSTAPATNNNVSAVPTPPTSSMAMGLQPVAPSTAANATSDDITEDEDGVPLTKKQKKLLKKEEEKKRKVETLNK